MGTTFTAPDSAGIEAGVYRARLSAMQTAKGAVADPETGEPRPYAQWTYELLEKGFEGRTIRDNTSLNFGQRSKARPRAEALLGRKIEGGETVGDDDLVGRECYLVVRPEETEKGTFAKIESVTPVEKIGQDEPTEDLPF